MENGQRNLKSQHCQWKAKVQQRLYVGNKDASKGGIPCLDKLDPKRFNL